MVKNQNKYLIVWYINLEFNKYQWKPQIKAFSYPNSDTKYSITPWGLNFILVKSTLTSCSVTKPTKWQVHPTKTRISLGIQLKEVWSLATHKAHSEDWSNWADSQADLSLPWAQGYIVVFFVLQLISLFS